MLRGDRRGCLRSTARELLGGVGGGCDGEGGESDATEALAAVIELVAAGVPRRQAADVVARLARISRNTLYAESLKSR